MISEFLSLFPTAPPNLFSTWHSSHITNPFGPLPLWRPSMTSNFASMNPPYVANFFSIPLGALAKVVKIDKSGNAGMGAVDLLFKEFR
jgi:hypothetical protein